MKYATYYVFLVFEHISLASLWKHEETFIWSPSLWLSNWELFSVNNLAKEFPSYPRNLKYQFSKLLLQRLLCPLFHIKQRMSFRQFIWLLIILLRQTTVSWLLKFQIFNSVDVDNSRDFRMLNPLPQLHMPKTWVGWKQIRTEIIWRESLVTVCLSL
jgi:hypothetical protein